MITLQLDMYQACISLCHRITCAKCMHIHILYRYDCCLICRNR